MLSPIVYNFPLLLLHTDKITMEVQSDNLASLSAVTVRLMKVKGLSKLRRSILVQHYFNSLLLLKDSKGTY